MWRLLPLLLLAACTNLRQPCRLSLAADLPARLEDTRLVVTGQVDGADTTLLVDTGAEASVITTGTVAALQLPRSQRSATRLSGVGGVVSNADVFADLALGPLGVRRRFAVAAIPGIGGVVGADILAAYDLELDLPDRRIRLWRAPGCGAADLPGSAPWKTVKLHLTAGDGLRLTVALDGHPLTALLDSGAGQSLLKADSVRRLGLPVGNLAADPRVLARGVDGAAIGLHLHRFDSLTVDDDTVAYPLISVGDFQLNSADMLLGVDYLLTRRLWVSYRMGEMFVQRAVR